MTVLNFARMDTLFSHSQGVDTDFVEEPPMNDDKADDGEGEDNSMTNETNLDNLIIEMSNEHNVSNIRFTSSSASVGSWASKRKLSNNNSHSITKKVLDEKHYRSSGVNDELAKFKNCELEFKKEIFQLDQSIAADRFTFDKSVAKEVMDFKTWALTQDHKQKLKQAKER